MAALDEHTSLPFGHPALRPEEETLFISRDAEMDAEEARLRFALLALAPGARHGAGLEAARTAVLGLQGTADDGLVIRKFAPESFLVIFSALRPMEAALRAGGFTIGTTTFRFRRWTRLVRAEVATLYQRVTLEIEGVPAHAWSWKIARKILASSCWIESMDAASESKVDMSKIGVVAWCIEPNRIPHSKTLIITEHEDPMVIEANQAAIRGLLPSLRKKSALMYRVAIHLRRIDDFEPRPPPPPVDGDGVGDADIGGFRDGGAPSSGHGLLEPTDGGLVGDEATSSCGARQQASAGAMDMGRSTPVSGPVGIGYPDASRVVVPPSQIGQEGSTPSPTATTLSSNDPVRRTESSCSVGQKALVVEFVPFELQCSRALDTGMARADPMRDELLRSRDGLESIIQTPSVRAVDAGATPVRPTLITYSRRAKVSVAEPVGPSRADLVSPTRLDFDDKGVTGSPPTWTMVTPRRSPRSARES